MDTDLDSFIKKLDYKAYENGWKDIGTNVFSLDTVKQEIQKIKLEEDLEMKDKIPRVLYNSL